MTSSHEHPGGLGPLWALRERLGVEIEVVDVGDGGDADAVVAAFSRALERPARALVVSHVLWTTGAVLPVARLGDLARDAGAVSVIDGAQSAGAIPVVLEDLGVDAYAVPGQKWLLGPEGMGALWVRRGLADAVTPATAGYLAYAVTGDRHAPPGRTAVRGQRLPPAVRHRLRAQPRVALDVRRPALGTGARAASPPPRTTASASSRGSGMVSPRSALGTLVTFRIDGWTAADALPELGRACLRDHPGPADDRRPADLGRLLEHRGGARPVRGDGGAARAAHAGLDPGAAHAGGPRRR